MVCGQIGDPGRLDTAGAGISKRKVTYQGQQRQGHFVADSVAMGFGLR